jgi:DNA helicase-2/ATP-dependent DNA helicase PcrA
VLEAYRDRFKYILVDEYQDTNASQYDWLKLLAEPRRNSVLRRRRRPIDLFVARRGGRQHPRFEQDFPGAKIIRLEQNYRSTPHILAAATGLIAHNAGRLGKTLWTEVNEGDRVSVIGVWDGPEEARRDRRGDRGASSQRRLARRLRHPRPRPVPDPRVRGAVHRHRPRLPDRRRLPLLRAGRDPRRPRLSPLAAQPADDLAFERIVNQPKRGLATRRRFNPRARARDRAALLLAAASMLDSDELQSRARNSLGRFVADIARWRQMAGEIPHPELARILLDESGYTAMLQAERSAEAAGRLENLAELTRAMEEYENLGAFLEHVSLVMDNDSQQSGDRVTIMTIHAAKGLEFPIVFLAGWEEGVFPSQRSLDEGGLASLEEERRLAYVAITRARRQATILHAANRRIYGQWTSSIPSRFVAELPATMSRKRRP